MGSICRRDPMHRKLDTNRVICVGRLPLGSNSRSYLDAFLGSSRMPLMDIFVVVELMLLTANDTRFE